MQFVVCEKGRGGEETVAMMLKVAQSLLLPRGKGYLLASLGYPAPGWNRNNTVTTSHGRCGEDSFDKYLPVLAGYQVLHEVLCMTTSFDPQISPLR